MLLPMRIIMKDCSIRRGNTAIINSVSWDTGNAGNWLVTGPNGSGKSVLVSALAGLYDIVPSESGMYDAGEGGSVAIVSFETAAALIEEERRRDDSDFVEGGVDPGRTPRAFIMETMYFADAPKYPEGAGLENHPAVALCGIAPILDRGLKYLSTGEIRRTLLAHALTARPELLVLDEPYDGLDVDSRGMLLDFLSTGLKDTRLIVVMDPRGALPASITHVLELNNRAVSFSGTLNAYRRRIDRDSTAANIQESRAAKNATEGTPIATPCDLAEKLNEARAPRDEGSPRAAPRANEPLVEMRCVTVEWSGRKVLDGLSWTLNKGEHWLIRGPNGSGKTTFLELITGDNPQVFRNDVRLFGVKRGSGETIWEIKERMGIVSYRLHTEYRALGEYPLETVLLSGLHDSIGLYCQCGEEERRLANQWLELSGFAGRGGVPFRDLSYGEQRAILIARAAIKQPPILILDEPCHGLDEGHRRLILALLQAIAERGESTLLHVTHDPEEVLPCERHVLELRPGESPMYRILESDARGPA